MPNRVQSLRSNTTGARPAGRQPGELYVNWADSQIGVVNAANAAQDLVAVRFFSTTANYAVGDFVIQGGQLYRATVASSAGSFLPANWEQIAGSAEFLPLAGGVMTGSLILKADPGALLEAATKQYVDGKAGSTMPAMDGAAAVGSAATWARADHVHPTDTSRAPVAGVTDGSNAAGGQIGEVISNVITTVVVLTTGVTAIVGQINLTPGDWDVCGEVWINVVAASISLCFAAINQSGQASPSAPILGGARTQVNPVVAAGNTQVLSLRTCRVSLTTATAYSLFAQSIFTGGGCNTTGVIWARRAR